MQVKLQVPRHSEGVVSGATLTAAITMSRRMPKTGPRCIDEVKDLLERGESLPPYYEKDYHIYVAKLLEQGWKLPSGRVVMTKAVQVSP